MVLVVVLAHPVVQPRQTHQPHATSMLGLLALEEVRLEWAFGLVWTHEPAMYELVEQMPNGLDVLTTYSNMEAMRLASAGHPERVEICDGVPMFGAHVEDDGLDGTALSYFLLV